MADEIKLNGDEISLFTQSVPEVQTVNDPKFNGTVTYKDFEEKINSEKPQKQKTEVYAENNTQQFSDNTIKAKKYTTIEQANEKLIQEIENGEAAEYIPSDENITSTDREAELIAIFHKLAEKDNANAQNILGVCYFTGISVAVDEQKAMEYFNSAAEFGEPAAQRNLAIIFENSVPPDTVRAIELYEKAAEQNDSCAVNNLAAAYMTGTGIKKDIKTAVKLFDKAAKLGDDFAMVNLADCYLVGNGIRKNDKKAFDLYQKAAQKGNIDGMKSLADCYYKGTGTAQDINSALKYYKMAADNGDIEAQSIYTELSSKVTPKKHETVKADISDTAKAVKKSSLDDKFKLGEEAAKNTEKEQGENKTPEISTQQSARL